MPRRPKGYDYPTEKAPSLHEFRRHNPHHSLEETREVYERVYGQPEGAGCLRCGINIDPDHTTGYCGDCTRVRQAAALIQDVSDKIRNNNTGRLSAYSSHYLAADLTAAINKLAPGPNYENEK
jgi:hypothetical protein